MTPEQAACLALLVGNAVLVSLLARLAFKRRPAAGTRPFALLMLMVAAWSLAYGFELAAGALPAKLFWAKIQYLFIPGVPAVWFVFGREYDGRFTQRAALAGIAGLPAVSTALALTNGWHALVWRRSEVASGPLPVLRFEYGPWFLVHVACSYLLLAGGTWFILRAAARSAPGYRRQAASLVLGGIAPWLANVVYLSEASPIPYLDPTPLAFTALGLAFSWALFRQHALELLPIARAALFDSMADGVIFLDARSRVLDINAAAPRLLGLGSAPRLGDAVACFAPELDAVLARRAPDLEAREELRLEGKDKPLELGLHIQPLTLRGVPGGRIVLISDETEQRSIERIKHELVSTASHELRTPLTSLRAALRLMASGAVGALPPEAIELAQLADRNARRLEALLQDLLDVERLESGRMPLSLAPCPVAALVAQAVDSIGAIARSQGIAIDTEPTPLWALADGDRIVQVLENLLSNALKFSPARSRVALTVGQQDGWVELRISDEGRGVPAALREAIFDRFRQVDASDARDKGGTGLGLAICKGIVAQHGGSIGVDPGVEGGSEFWFRLPAAHPPGTERTGNATAAGLGGLSA